MIICHSPCFRCWNVDGVLYHFTRLQARVMEWLLRAWQDGTPSVDQHYLLVQVESDSATLRSVFKCHGKLHPAWGTLIVPGRASSGASGTYRLNIPPGGTVDGPSISPIRSSPDSPWANGMMQKRLR
jgi:hypothetical protein